MATLKVATTPDSAVRPRSTEAIMTTDTLLPTATYDLATTTTRELNAALHATEAPASVEVANPQGAHALACGLNRPIDVRIDGHVATTPPV
ncbi:hypothetical protein NJ76_04995 [Rhodococcus sp. IITR03]|nr:hypothetical protein NJ76_04995 [Rhodococcus sp. IITR03]